MGAWILRNLVLLLWKVGIHWLDGAAVKYFSQERAQRWRDKEVEGWIAFGKRAIETKSIKADDAIYLFGMTYMKSTRVADAYNKEPSHP